jgi:hypothetical protein
LAAVHRSRLFAQHLPSFDWEPVILTVDEKYYEEKFDWNLFKLLPINQRIEKVKSFPITKPRLIGDLGLRGFFQLRKKALELVINQKVDFVYIPIPSFYVSLIGPYLHRKTGVKYGIDYIDPWVHFFPGSEKIFSRHWFSTKLAKLLEPVAIKNASLITGVSEGYYKGVQERNPELLKTTLFAAMPYGGEINDHLAVKTLGLNPYLFSPNNKFQLVYAGAMLPKAYQPLEAIFKNVSKNIDQFSNVEFHFIGTGKKTTDPTSYTIRALAEKYGLWNSIVFEYPARIPYLDVLIHLDAAKGIFILGSTEPHYTPSKTYQAVLSRKPILAVLHNLSTALEIIKNTNAGIGMGFNGEEGVSDLQHEFSDVFTDYLQFANTFDTTLVDFEAFNEYSAKNVTARLVENLNLIIS